MNNKRKSGFTLIELIVVVVIIGILAGLIVPSFLKARERAMDKQAKVILQLIRAAERNYKLKRGTYYPDPGAAVTSLSFINGNLSLDLVNDGNWDIYYLNGNYGFLAILYRDRGGYNRRWWINSTMTEALCEPLGGLGCPS